MSTFIIIIIIIVIIIILNKFLSIYPSDLSGDHWDEIEKAWAEAEQDKWVEKRKFKLQFLKPNSLKKYFLRTLKLRCEQASTRKKKQTNKQKKQC